MDEAAFARAVTDCRVALFRFAASLTSLADAEDLVQDALVRAWDKRRGYDAARGSVQAWLLGIVADQARRRWRTTRGSGLTLPEDVSPAPSPVSADLRRAIGQLPARQRTAVILRHYVDLTVEDVAALMNCAPGTVKSTLHDAHQRLSQLLGVSYVRD